jgi:hypothetical protein
MLKKKRQKKGKKKLKAEQKALLHCNNQFKLNKFKNILNSGNQHDRVLYTPACKRKKH